MARTILIVNATQVVTSENHPLGILSNVSGFPQTFDSNNAPYNGDIEATMKAAKSAYHTQIGANYANTNPNRVMTTVILETVRGTKIQDCPPVTIGTLPIPPEPESESTPTPTT